MKKRACEKRKLQLQSVSIVFKFVNPCRLCILFVLFIPSVNVLSGCFDVLLFGGSYHGLNCHYKFLDTPPFTIKTMIILDLE